jgi:hypothetical protein
VYVGKWISCERLFISRTRKLGHTGFLYVKEVDATNKQDRQHC